MVAESGAELLWFLNYALNHYGGGLFMVVEWLWWLNRVLNRYGD